jgi:hypothetical protein
MMIAVSCVICQSILVLYDIYISRHIALPRLTLLSEHVNTVIIWK